MKRLSPRSLLLMFVFVLALSSVVHAAMPWANFDSLKSRVAFLAGTHRAIPRMLNSRATFDRDPFELLPQQAGIRNEVQRDEAYAHLLAERPASLLFEVHAQGASVESETIAPAALAEWRHEISSALEGILANTTDIPWSRRDFAGSIDRELHAAMGKGTPEGRAKAVAYGELRVLAVWDHNHDHDERLEGLRNWVMNLGEGDLDLFREADAVHRGLEGAGLDQAAADKLFNSMRDRTTEVSRQRVKGISKFSGTMTVEDVAPDVATMRGFFGDDCATAYSFAYPNSPLERTFFIYDEHGAPLAYAAGTHIRFDGRPAFYLHTINGPTINSAQVDEILRAFDTLKGHLGAETIVLPVEHRVNENMNYNPIKSAYRSALAGGHEGGIEYRDSAVRWYLNETTEAHYDRESANTRGVEYQPKTRAAGHATVDEKSYTEARSLLAYDPVGPIDLLMLAYGLEQSGRVDASKRVLEISQISHEEYAGLKNLLDNTAGLPTKEYQAAVREYVRARDVHHGDVQQGRYSRDALWDYQNYFLRGALLAPDALSFENAQATLKGVIGLIQAGEISTAGTVISRNPGAFASSKEFRAVVAELPTNVCGPLWRAGLSPDLFPTQVADLRARLSSNAWWEASGAASELSVMAPKKVELYADMIQALRSTSDPRAAARMSLALIHAGIPDFMDYLPVVARFTYALPDARMSPEEMVRAVQSLSWNVPRGVPYSLNRTMTALANNPEVDDYWRGQARELAERWAVSDCSTDMHTRVKKN